MQTITKGVRGLSVLMNVNWDRLIALGILAAALLTGAFIGSLIHGY
ncbi:MAG: hypothetical protein WCZ72_00875 [Gemmobacter sp.]